MSAFYPTQWKEDPTPANWKDCTDCGLYKHGTRMVWGEGNPDAPIMIILDNPGSREDREGKPMVCGTRETLQRALNEVGLTKDHIYVTYILKRRPTHAYEKEETRTICMQHLEQQLALHKPSLILCMGNVAVQSFFHNNDVDVKKLRGTWHDIRGFQTTVAYHPLAVRRRPNLYPLLISDLSLVSEELRS